MTDERTSTDGEDADVESLAFILEVGSMLLMHPHADMIIFLGELEDDGSATP